MRTTRIATSVLTVAATIALAVAATGCATSGGSGVTLSSAKTKALAMEKQIAAFVPAASVVSSQQTTTSKVIYPCVGHSGQSYWPGSYTATLKDGVNEDDVLTAIAQKWTGKKGWTVFEAIGTDGNKTVNIKGSTGSFAVEIVDGPQLSITAGSACFPSSGLSGKSSY